jgi:hypothetical protein
VNQNTVEITNDETGEIQMFKARLRGRSVSKFDPLQGTESALLDFEIYTEDNRRWSILITESYQQGGIGRGEIARVDLSVTNQQNNFTWEYNYDADVNVDTLF